jgi:hypothetical protein
MTAPDRGAGHWCCFPDPSHFHAEMMRFQEYSYAVRVQHRFKGIGDLLSDPFLDRETL